MSFPSSASSELGGIHPPPPRLDPRGRFRARAHLSYGVIGFYVFLLLLIFLLLRPPATNLYVEALLALLVLVFLLRYLTTTYVIDDRYLRARRLFGGQKVLLKEVRRIEFTSLRDLSATGFWGAWGWRGRMWSPQVGKFDCIHTDAKGILVTAGDFPLFVSPADRDEFAQELSRRVRSLGGRLMADEAEAPGPA